MEIEIAKIEGLEEIDRVFKNLPKAMERRAYRGALRAGATVVRNAARNNLASVSDKNTGVLHRAGSVAVYNMRKYRGAYRAGVMIRRGLVNNMVRDGRGAPVRVGLYASVLEYGSTKRNQPPRSWLRSAIRGNVQTAYNAVQESIFKSIDKALSDAMKGE